MACASEPVLGVCRIASSEVIICLRECCRSLILSSRFGVLECGGKRVKVISQTGLHIAEPEDVFPVRVDPSVLWDPNLNVGMNPGVALI